jgi:hypothetical protein
MRKQYKREDLGKGVRGKHFAAYSKGTNLVLISPDVAAVFPTAQAVNEALRGLVQLAEKAARPTTRSSGRAEKRRRALQAPRRRAA